MTESWERHFRKLYSKAQNEQMKQELQESKISSTQWIVTKEGIEAMARKLKNCKVSGSDEIMNEIIKYGGEALQKKLKILFNKTMARH